MCPYLSLFPFAMNRECICRCHSVSYFMYSRDDLNCIGGCAQVISKYFVILYEIWASWNSVSRPNPSWILRDNWIVQVQREREREESEKERDLMTLLTSALIPLWGLHLLDFPSKYHISKYYPIRYLIFNIQILGGHRYAIHSRYLVSNCFNGWMKEF